MSGCTRAEGETGAATEYERLCRDEAGVHVYEKVEGVSGVLDEVSETSCRYCHLALLTFGYKFVEYRVTKSVLSGNYPALYVNGRGLYRFTLESQNHSNCKLSYEFYAPRIKRGFGLPEDFKGKCIATWKIKNIKSKYKITESESYENFPDGVIGIDSLNVVRISDSKILGEHKRISFVPLRIIGDPASRNKRGMKRCTGHSAPGQVIGETLIPSSISDHEKGKQ